MMSRLQLLWFGGLLAVGPTMGSTCPNQPPSNNVCFANPGNNSLDSIYVGPYTAFLNGSPVATSVIADDFTAATLISTGLLNSQSWQATSATIGSGGSGEHGALNSTAYKEAAWLSQLLISTPSNASAISYAIWNVFNPATAGYLQLTGDSTTLGKVNALVAQAASHTGDNFSNVSVYTPTTQVLGVPAEFIVVRTPEASAIAMLVVYLSCLGGLFFMMRFGSALKR